MPNRKQQNERKPGKQNIHQESERRAPEQREPSKTQRQQKTPKQERA